MDKTFMEAMDFRHACKVFDDTKKISDYIRNTMKDFPGNTGPFNIREDGERVGAKFVVYKMKNDGTKEVVGQ